MNKTLLISISIIFLLSCSSEPCIINFKNNTQSFQKTLGEIHSLNLKHDSKKPYYRVVKSFTKSSSPFKCNIFDQVEYIECHEDGTIIFQAPNCNQESGFRDIVYFVAYSPLGKPHIEGKRNIGKIKNIGKNWYSGTHITTLAN